MAPMETSNHRDSTMKWFSQFLATAVVALGCPVAAAAAFHVATNSMNHPEVIP